jgi:hypothetical protein
MKKNLLTVLAFIPTLTVANVLPIVSGTGQITNYGPYVSVQGAGFSIAGGINVNDGYFLLDAYTPGTNSLTYATSYTLVVPPYSGEPPPPTSLTQSFTISINNQPWSLEVLNGESINLQIDMPLKASGPGIVQEPFTLSGNLDLVSLYNIPPTIPPITCPATPWCTDWQLEGSGIASVTLVQPEPDEPWVYPSVISLAFSAVPTPSTPPLMLLGLVALLWPWRRAGVRDAIGR